jgi:uncharacterized membrane protein YeaQ/YmgE (transglycosylase-associated protein family)
MVLLPSRLFTRITQRLGHDEIFWAWAAFCSANPCARLWVMIVRTHAPLFHLGASALLPGSCRAVNPLAGLQLMQLTRRCIRTRTAQDSQRYFKENAMLYSIIVGLIAGWLAGQVMKGGGYGVLMDLILGLLGGIVGGWLFGTLGIWPGGGIIGSIIVSFVGAVVLVAITRMLKRA